MLLLRSRASCRLPPNRQTLPVATTIAQNAPTTIRAIQEIPDDPDIRNLDEVDALVQACFASEDYKEGRHAFMQRRRPQFQDK